MLEVDVLLEDGSVKSRVTNHSPVTLSAQQIEESRTRLSALKIYPRDMLIDRTLKPNWKSCGRGRWVTSEKRLAG
ncbi:hypothetical protein ACNKHT_04345 [Shigella flexneri]